MRGWGWGWARKGGVVKVERKETKRRVKKFFIQEVFYYFTYFHNHCYVN